MADPAPASTSFLRRCLLVAATALGALALIWFVWTTAHALLLVFSALLVAVGLDGVAKLVVRITHLPRAAAVLLTAATLAAVIGAALTWGVMNVTSQASRLRIQVEQSINRIEARVGHYDVTQKLVGKAQASGKKSASQPGGLGQRITNELPDAALGTVSALTDLFVIVVIGLYLALQPKLYRDGLLRLFPPAQQARVVAIGAQAATAIRRWLSGRIISMTVVGIGSVAGLKFLGIQFPVLLGLLAGLLTFIPYLGALISAVPALLIAALQGYDAVFYVGGLYLGLHILEGYLFAPLIQKHAVSIAPAFLLASQVLGGAVAGVFGIALAAPIALVVAVVIQLTYVRDVMGERPHMPGAHQD